jgi:hypothetical protein
MAAEPNIKGIPVTQITSIMGVPITSVKNIAGIRTLDIPSWPGIDSPPPSCDMLLLGYSSPRSGPPALACSADPMPYELDPLTNILYTEGGCGNAEELASGGFYSDGVMIYTIGPDGTFMDLRPCDG